MAVKVIILPWPKRHHVVDTAAWPAACQLCPCQRCISFHSLAAGCMSYMPATPLVCPVPPAKILTCTSCTYGNHSEAYEKEMCGLSNPLNIVQLPLKRCPDLNSFFILFFNTQLLSAFVQSHRNFILGPADNHSTSLPSFQPHNHFS